ncbi:MAG: hypothetical protein NTW04_04575, partial [Elusimicrobia bacterium]|nr:hypothetical protein [Elusimicrobiota bacterium]
ENLQKLKTALKIEGEKSTEEILQIAIDKGSIKEENLPIGSYFGGISYNDEKVGLIFQNHYGKLGINISFGDEGDSFEDIENFFDRFMYQASVLTSNPAYNIKNEFLITEVNNMFVLIFTQYKQGAWFLPWGKPVFMDYAIIERNQSNYITPTGMGGKC